MEDNNKEIIEVEKETKEEAEVIQNQETKVKGKNGMAIASMVLGIVGTVLIFRKGILALVCGILAIVFAVISKKKNGKNGMATAGLILGIIDLSLSVVFILIAIIFVGTIAGMICA